MISSICDNHRLGIIGAIHLGMEATMNKHDKEIEWLINELKKYTISGVPTPWEASMIRILEQKIQTEKMLKLEG
jgi:hypothetical protein